RRAGEAGGSRAERGAAALRLGCAGGEDGTRLVRLCRCRRDGTAPRGVTTACSPLPCTRGRGVGGEGVFPVRETPSHPLTVPSPPSTGERGINVETDLMKIVHLTASTFYGGPERQMLGLAQHLPERYETRFLSFAEGGRCRSFLGAVRQAGFE